MPQKILVTGASGFVASHVIRHFLEAGFKVRGTVRNPSAATKVKESHQKYTDALSFASLKGIPEIGAFDEAAKDVDGLIHTASPFILNARDYKKELFDPAVNGTLSVLQAVKEHNPSVKRIVITCSFASVEDCTNNAGWTRF